MPGLASATGLLPARLRSVTDAKRKSKRVELSSTTRPAPIALKPFAGIFNPYSQSCSVLCNHPAPDRGIKDVICRTKDSRSLDETVTVHLGNLPVPEEFFRRYTETDSRPATPTTPEKPSLVVDLRAKPQDQESETLTWHAIILEEAPSVSCARRHARPIHRTTVPDDPCTPRTASSDDEQVQSPSRIFRRRGKRLRKRKCRRGSQTTYSQQTEVRGPDEPAETQISQTSDIADVSGRSSRLDVTGETAPDEPRSSQEKTSISNLSRNTPSSFLPSDILKHLCRELDKGKVEVELSLRRRLALEEALRARAAAGLKVEIQQTPRGVEETNAPRFFTRQAASFQILDSESLRGLGPIEYLARYARISRGRLRRYREIFKEHCDETDRLPASAVERAISRVLGNPLTEKQETRLRDLFGEVEEYLGFREWCGLCAGVERLLPTLPPRSMDPPSPLEIADFETLTRRLRAVPLDPRLVRLLEGIRDG